MAMSQQPKKLYECEFPGCDKAFKFKSWLTKHAEGHSALKSLKCPHDGCWKYFKRPDTLKSHMRIHTGEKPFACEERGCEAKFTSQAGLRYHQLKHKNKSYRCGFPDCGRHFLTLSQVKQHEQSKKHTSLTQSLDGTEPSPQQFALDLRLTIDHVLKKQQMEELVSLPISLVFALSEPVNRLDSR